MKNILTTAVIALLFFVSTEISAQDKAKINWMSIDQAFEAIKKEFGLPEKDVLDLMKKKLTNEKFELWKKKAVGSKPKPKPIIDDFDDDLEGKYYIKNKFD